MFIITTKDSNTVIGFGELKKYWDNGYPVINYNGQDIAYPINVINLYEVIDTPEDLVEGKYCYTEKQGFYINPNWVEPDSTNTYGIPDDIYHSIIDDYTETLIESGVL